MRKSGADLRCVVGLSALTLALVTTGCSGSSAVTTTSSSPAVRTVSRSISGVVSASSAAGAASPASGGPVAPSTGSVNQIVPARQQPTRPAVALTRAADFGRSVTLRLSAISAVLVHARTPGEFSGPALQLTFTIRNGSASAIDLTGFVVNVTDSRGTPAPPVTTPPTAPFRGSVRAGGSARGVYVFTVATSRRQPVTVSATYTAAAPVVLFRGNTK